jgi:hypothetical protein
VNWADARLMVSKIGVVTKWVRTALTREADVKDIDNRTRVRGGRLRMPRSRGAASGFLLTLLGIWGAAAPFIGPNLGFSFSPSQEWSAARGWLEVLPGVVTVIGGSLLTLSRNRISAMLGAWLSVIAGAWFVIGRAVAGPLELGDVGTPVAPTDTQRLLLELSYFHGLGALIVFLGAVALGRLSVRSFRDVEYAARPVSDSAELPEPDIEPASRRREWAMPFGRRGSHAH